MICIIPARGGSRRIYKKNVKPFFGAPVIRYSIETALSSGLFSQVVISTDCPHVIDIYNEHYGCNGGIFLSRRPSRLAHNEVGIRDVIKHEISRSKNIDLNSLITCLFPVAPFVSYDDLKLGIDMVIQPEVDFVFVGRKLEVPVEKILVTDKLGLTPLFGSKFLQPSQNLSKGYYDLGQFYTASARKWASSDPLISEGSRCLLWDEFKGVDVDTSEDWRRLEKNWHANLRVS
jgi:pseudaminic acid cytidylyltransferase